MLTLPKNQNKQSYIVHFMSIYRERFIFKMLQRKLNLYDGYHIVWDTYRD